ncbi:MAG: ribonuclease J [Actinobacteria bacterium]|nr:ribonuclease J [Actinomycetota bacterium]
MHLARELGELDYDLDDEVDMTEIDRHEREGLVVISTGSQGEPYSALSLMAAGEHRVVAIGRGDLVVLASSIIPGNERPIYRSINGLVRRGARVLHRGIADVHVSGHAARDDLILFHNIVQPEYVVPIHGEQRHMVAHRDIAIETGCLADHVLICEDGDTVVVQDGRVHRGEQVRAGLVLLDGLLSDVGPAILRDRRRLGEDGVCICIITVDVQRRALGAEPTVVQKGVVFAEQDELLEGAQKAVVEELSGPARDKFGDLSALQRHVTQSLGTYWRAQTGRRPVIMPIVVEI